MLNKSNKHYKMLRLKP